MTASSSGRSIVLTSFASIMQKRTRTEAASDVASSPLKTVTNGRAPKAAVAKGKGKAKAPVAVESDSEDEPQAPRQPQASSSQVSPNSDPVQVASDDDDDDDDDEEDDDTEQNLSAMQQRAPLADGEEESDAEELGDDSDSEEVARGVQALSETAQTAGAIRKAGVMVQVRHHLPSK